MLTQEQIKNLKPGDPLIIHGTYIRNHTDGDIVIKCNMTIGGGQSIDYKVFHPSCVSIPSEHGTSVPTTKHDPTRTFCHVVDNMVKPKYDPNRLFKEGDIVRVVEWHGRHFHDRDHGTELTTGCICEVDEDEKETITEGYQNILVTYQEQVRFIQPCFLELVTPVEELEPYTQGKGIDEQNIYKNGDLYAELKDAKEAEIVCKLLNAEYRKEQSNDK